MGNEVLKQLHQEMSLEKVEKLMDQTKEGVEYQRVCPVFTCVRILAEADQLGNRRDAAISNEPRRRRGSTS